MAVLGDREQAASALWSCLLICKMRALDLVVSLAEWGPGGPGSG